MKYFHFVCMFLLVAWAVVPAQTNPIPFVYQPLIPASVTPGSGAFTLTVN